MMIFKSFFSGLLVTLGLVGGSALALELECELYSEELDTRFHFEMQAEEINGELYFIGSSSPTLLGQWQPLSRKGKKGDRDEVTCRSIKSQSEKSSRNRRWNQRMGLSNQEAPLDSRGGTLFSY